MAVNLIEMLQARIRELALGVNMAARSPQAMAVANKAAGFTTERTK